MKPHPLAYMCAKYFSPIVRNSKRKKQPGSTKKSKPKEPKKSPTKGMTASFSQLQISNMYSTLWAELL